MSAGNFKHCLELLLKSEGGWVNHPSDPGGETNLGVTKAVWEEYVGHPVKTLKNLTKEDVAPLYEQRYWRPTYGEVLLLARVGLPEQIGKKKKPLICVKTVKEAFLGVLQNV